MSTHLLTLADLHAAAPGVIDVVFGPDGDFGGAPDWSCSLLIAPDYGGWYTLCASPQLMREGVKILFADTGTLNMADCNFDLRVHSIYARMMRLCSMVADVDADLNPQALASLTLALAPRIAALKDAK